MGGATIGASVGRDCSAGEIMFGGGTNTGGVLSARFAGTAGTMAGGSAATI
jgi:hypothetical protein